MSFYIVLYFLIVFISLYIGFVYYRKNTNSLSNIYFFITILFFSSRFLIYIFTYFGIENKIFLLYLIRLLFGLSISGVYSFIIFIIYFGNKGNTKKGYYFLAGFLFLLGFYVFTPFIIESLEFNELKNDFYENIGKLFFIHILLFVINIILSVYFSIKKYLKVSLINKIRIKYILFGGFLFIISSFILQSFLPFFDIYLLEKEIIFFSIPFVVSIFYTSNRYYFSDVKFKYSVILSFFFSIFFTILLTILIKSLGLSFGENFINYWGFESNFTYIDLIFNIIVFYLFYLLFSYIIPGNKEYIFFINILNKIKEQIPFFNNLYDLNNFLVKKAESLYNMKTIGILLKKGNEDLEIFKFFENNIINDVFINDIVFLEENKNKFNLFKISKEIKKGIFLIFPMINNKGELIGVFELGAKPFKEQYYSEEIDILKDFVNFLVGHLKYIDIYSKINKLNLNLDKEVDKKTIKYNNLLNKQKEFISIASHEIKTPVMASAFQIESIIDDINYGEIDFNNLKSELDILKEQIFKLSDLVKVIFSAQKYDIKKIELYLEKVKIKNLFIGEINSLKKKNKDLNIDFIFSDEINFVDIDKVQFTQVISNLLNNAFKFSDSKKPIIKITVNDLMKDLEIIIEDNGKGFRNGEYKNIFDKYSTGKGSSIGLGLGLYLCKKIIELHKGSINVSNSKDLSGAKFNLVIPKIQKKDS